MYTLLTRHYLPALFLLAIPGSFTTAKIAMALSEFEVSSQTITNRCDGRSVYVKPAATLKPGDTVSSDEFPEGRSANELNKKSKTIKDLLDSKLGTVQDVSGDKNPYCLNSCDDAGTDCIPTGLRPYPGGGADVGWDNNPPPAKGNKKYKVTIEAIRSSGLIRIATECECIQKPS